MSASASKIWYWWTAAVIVVNKNDNEFYSRPQQQPYHCVIVGCKNQQQLNTNQDFKETKLTKCES